MDYKIIKWSNINWTDKLFDIQRIIFPNNIEAEVCNREQAYPGPIFHTLRFAYNFVDRNLQKDFLISCYEVFELLQKQEFIKTCIEFNVNNTSYLGVTGERFTEYNIEIRFGV